MREVWTLWYRRVNAYVNTSPTLRFGEPFVTSMVIGTFFLAQITQARYIQHDHKIRVMSQEEKLDLQRDRKPIDIREEYFVRYFQAGRH